MELYGAFVLTNKHLKNKHLYKTQEIIKTAVTYKVNKKF